MKKFKPIEVMTEFDDHIICKGMHTYKINLQNNRTVITDENKKVIVDVPGEAEFSIPWLQNREHTEYITEFLNKIPGLIERAVNEVFKKQSPPVPEIPECPKCGKIQIATYGEDMVVYCGKCGGEI